MPKRFLGKAFRCFLALFFLINIITAFHAYKFTHYTSGLTKPSHREWNLSFTDKLSALLFGVSLPRPENQATPAVGFKTITVNSNKRIECWYMKRQTSKGTVIVCHGYGGSKGSMLDKATVFHELGYSVLLPDFMGSGGSEGSETTIGFKEAQQVSDCATYLRKQGEQNIILFGTSLGAAAIMKAVHDDTLQVSGLILECPFGTMLQTVKNRFKILGVPSTPLAHLLVFWGGTINGFNAFSHNPETYAASITTPVLLMHGAEDPKVTAGEIDRIYNNLKGSRRLVTFQNTGHSNYLLNNKEAWVQAVDSFLNTEGHRAQTAAQLTPDKYPY
jgi:pimeloyl-ACP methyl ester carboxylesterase